MKNERKEGKEKEEGGRRSFGKMFQRR